MKYKSISTFLLIKDKSILIPIVPSPNTPLIATDIDVSIVDDIPGK